MKINRQQLAAGQTSAHPNMVNTSSTNRYSFTHTFSLSPVQNEVNIKSSVARRVVVVAQRRARANSDKKQDSAKRPRVIHNALLSCPQGAHQRQLASVIAPTCWVGGGWRSADVQEQERAAGPRRAALTQLPPLNLQSTNTALLHYCCPHVSPFVHLYIINIISNSHSHCLLTLTVLRSCKHTHFPVVGQ